MYFENYSVRVFLDNGNPANENGKGQVALVSGEKYRIRLKNHTYKDSACSLAIDGKFMGNFFVGKKSHVDIERPAHDSGRFTFYTVNSKEGRQVELEKEVAQDLLGLIEAKFTPIADPPTIFSTGLYKTSINSNRKISFNASVNLASDFADENSFGFVSFDEIPKTAGGTALSEESKVDYRSIDISPERYLHNDAVTIRLRLIGVESYNSVRKLTDASVRETPIPPRV
jgi:hypothetical protein